jgi:hypothetical protein
MSSIVSSGRRRIRHNVLALSLYSIGQALVIPNGGSSEPYRATLFAFRFPRRGE